MCNDITFFRMKTTTHSINGFPFTLSNLLVIGAILFIILLWLYMKWNYMPINKLAAQIRGPKTYPLIGMAYNFIGTQQKILENLIKIIDDYNPGPIKLYVGPLHFCVILIKPEDVQIVLNNSMALQKGWVYNFVKVIVGEGIFTASVDKWKVHRRLINPVFKINQLQQFLPIFNEKSQVLIRNLQIEVGKIQQFDLWNYIISINVDMICHTSMGYDNSTELNNSDYKLFTKYLKEALDLVAMRCYKPWYYPDIVFSTYLKLIGQHNIFEKLKKLPNKIVKENIDIYTKRKHANITNVDNKEEKEKGIKIFINKLLESNDGDGNFSNDEIRDEVVTMMIAGSETSAIVESFCLLMLAIHPDIQDKVYDEIYEVLGDSDRSITFEDLSNLVYLEQVLKETLRLFPSVPLYLRKLQGDIEIDNYTLPKGIHCVLAPIGTHRMPELYPNPLTFNPENFSPVNVAKRHTYSFIPFSRGPRGCIGEKYAMLSMKVLVATFLRNFSVHTDMNFSDIKLKVDTLLRSVDGYPVTIRPRNRIPPYTRF